MIKITEFFIPNKMFTQKEMIDIIKDVELRVREGSIINIIADQQTKLKTSETRQDKKTNQHQPK